MEGRPSGDVEASRASRAKQVIAGVLTLAVIVLVFVGIFPQFADYGQAWDAVQRISALGLVALVAVTVANVVVYVWPFQAAVPGLSFSRAFVVRHTSFMISNVVPAGGAIGLGTQYAMLGSYGVNGPQATAAIGITALFNVLVMIGLPVLAILLALLTGGVTLTGVVIAVGGVVVIGLVIGALALVFRSEALARRLGDLTEKPVRAVLRRIGRDRELGFANAVARFRGSTVEVIQTRWASITVTNVLAQIAQFAILYVALAGIQAGAVEQISLADAFIAFAFARLASFIPITPGGLGTVDTAMVAILSALGASNPAAVAAVLVWRALSLFPSALLGVITFLLWRRHSTRAAVGAGVRR